MPNIQLHEGGESGVKPALIIYKQENKQEKRIPLNVLITFERNIYSIIRQKAQKEKLSRAF